MLRVITYVGHFCPSDFCLIPALYAESPAFYAIIFLLSSIVLVTYVVRPP